ncbi:hypothetical protein [Brasilonema sp. UFV-L1]
MSEKKVDAALTGLLTMKRSDFRLKPDNLVKTYILQVRSPL